MMPQKCKLAKILALQIIIWGVPADDSALFELVNQKSSYLSQRYETNFLLFKCIGFCRKMHPCAMGGSAVFDA